MPRINEELNEIVSKLGGTPKGNTKVTDTLEEIIALLSSGGGGESLFTITMMPDPATPHTFTPDCTIEDLANNLGKLVKVVFPSESFIYSDFPLYGFCAEMAPDAICVFYFTVVDNNGPMLINGLINAYDGEIESPAPTTTPIGSGGGGGGGDTEDFLTQYYDTDFSSSSTDIAVRTTPKLTLIGEMGPYYIYETDSFSTSFGSKMNDHSLVLDIASNHPDFRVLDILWSTDGGTTFSECGKEAFVGQCNGYQRSSYRSSRVIKARLLAYKQLSSFSTSSIIVHILSRNVNSYRKGQTPVIDG